MNHLPTLSSLLSAGWATFKKNWKFIVSAAIVTVLIMIVLQILKSALNYNMVALMLITLISIVVGVAVTLGWTQVFLRLSRTGSASWNDFKTTFRSWGHYLIARFAYSFFIGLGIMLIFAPILLIVSKQLSVGLIILSVLASIVGIVYSLWFLVRYVFLPMIIVDQSSKKSLFKPFAIVLISGIIGLALGKLTVVLPIVVLIGIAIYLIIYSREFFMQSAHMTRGNMWKILGYVIVFGLINLLGLICIVIGLFVTVPVTKLAMTNLYKSLKEKSA